MKYINTRTYKLLALLSLALVSSLSTAGPVWSREKQKPLLSITEIAASSSPSPESNSLQGIYAPPVLSDDTSLKEVLGTTVEDLPLDRGMDTQIEVAQDETNEPTLTYAQRRNGYIKNIVGSTLLTCGMTALTVAFFIGDAPLSDEARIAIASPYGLVGLGSTTYAAKNVYHLCRLRCGKEEE